MPTVLKFQNYTVVLGGSALIKDGMGYVRKVNPLDG
jgi:hypothetical protein